MADGTPIELEDDAGTEQEAQASEAMERLKAVVARAIEEAASESDSDRSEFRENASDRYYGRPYGDEVAGRSAVVSRDIMETTEWVVAQLLRIFTGDKFCELAPTGPEDVDAAKQQTDFINHVIMQDSDGTILFYDWFKDALLHRTGVVHWGYLDTTKPTYEKYTGITQEQLQALLMDEAEPVEMSQREEQGEDGQPAVVFDVMLRKLVKKRSLKVEVIPGEEFILDKSARSIDDSTVTGHMTRKTRSDLRAEGVPESIIERLQPDDDEDKGEARARDVDKGRTDTAADTLGSGEDDQERFWLYTLYVKHDYDGDGYAELLRVRYVGEEIIEIEPAMETPYAHICPIRTPHRFDGLSLTDVVEDIQRIKTVLWRQALDNLYAANRPQREAVEGKVNPEDLKKTEIGAVIRVKEAGSVRDLTVPVATDSTLAMIGYIDQVREERTGTSAASQGRDADQIHDTARGMAQMVSQAQMRVELIARLFAEGGVKRLFLGLYNAIVRNQDAPRMVRLRGKFVRVNPAEWRERNDITVTVGLGSGTREAAIATLQMIATMQESLLEKGTPLVTVEKLKHTLVKMIEAAGFRDAGSFLAEPEEIPPPAPPPESEAIQIAKLQLQIEQAKIQANGQNKQADLQASQTSEQGRMRLEIAKLRSDDMERQRAHEREMAKLGQASKYDAEKLAQDDRQFYDKLLHDAVLAREKGEMQADEARRQSVMDEAVMKATQDDEPAEMPTDAGDQG